MDRNSEKTSVIIGGGAAGYFGAIEAVRRDPQAKVVILEATRGRVASGVNHNH